MSFFGTSFIFDGVPSETYDLFISSPDGGDVEVTGTNSVTLITQSIFKRSVPYLYGAKQEPVLQFEIAVNSPTEITAIDAMLINKWLFGHVSYKRLQIVQPDMDQIYFNCILNNPRLYKVGNRIYGFRATVICDAPWAWEMDKTITWSWPDTNATISSDYLSFDSSYVIGDSNTGYAHLPCFYNTADNNDYIYPYVEFVINSAGGGFGLSSIYDRDEYDISHTFSFERFYPRELPYPQYYSLLPHEKITVDNDLQIIKSYLPDGNGGYVESGHKRMDRFGFSNPATGKVEKQWLRFKPGKNVFIVAGSVVSLLIRYRIPRKISG